MAVGTIKSIKVSYTTNTVTTTITKAAGTITKYHFEFKNTAATKVLKSEYHTSKASLTSETFKTTGLTPGQSYKLYVTPINGASVGVTRIYQNTTTTPANVIKMKSSTTSSQKTTGSNSSAPAADPNSSTKGDTVSSNGAYSSNTGANGVLNNPGRKNVLVEDLSPGQNYKIQIFAVKTDADGKQVHSEYSLPLYVTTPSKSSSGANVSVTKTGVNTQLVGGAIYAGDFASDTGSINVVTDEVSGTGVILNQSGLAGFNNGEKEFYIDALTGRAYFAGTVTAGTVTIGSNINNSGNTGIYIDAKNYWYSDGKFSASAEDVAGAITNLDPINLLPDPDPVTNIVTSWTGSTFKVDWDYNPASSNNKYIKNFVVSFKSGMGTIKKVTVPADQTQYELTLTLNRSLFGLVQTTFAEIKVLVEDKFGNISASASASSIATYVSDLPTPVISVTSVNNGYSVAYTTPTSSSFNIISIEESSTQNGTYTPTYLGSINPAVVLVSDIASRWVKARFTDQMGAYTPYSTAYQITPTNPVSLDLTPPNEVASASAVWNGDDVVVSYTLPSSDPASRIQIQLTAPNLLVGYFYRFPSGSGTSQTTTITKKDLFDQFGEHYSSFSAILRSIDSADNRSSGFSFNVPARVNPLLGIVPTFTTVGLSNAYSVTFTLPTGAAFGEVYAKHTAWTSDPTDDTYVVYSGASPAVIVDTVYTPVYIKVRYYDDFGNTSNYSTQSNNSVTPINAGEITSFENPISFGANAVIYAGTSATSGTRTLFKSGGIYAYDATQSSPSTQIISSASAGTPTFITTQAQIANWKVTDNKIENTLDGLPTKYTGLSAAGTYAFWAGSDVSGGNSSADFTVTPTGAVTARNIAIVGNGNGSTNLISAGGLFTVKNDGTVTATSATITGNITASSGSFTGNVSVGLSGSLYSGTVVPGSPPQVVGQGFILNKSGLTFNSSSINGITTIDGTTGLFTTSSAVIGGWQVSTIYNPGSLYRNSSNGSIVLDSLQAQVRVANPTNTYRAGINAPSTATGTDVVFWAGAGPNASTNNNFVVQADGTAQITGEIRATAGYIGSKDGTTGWEFDSTTIKSVDSSLMFTANGTSGIITSTGEVPVGGGLIDVGYLETLDDGSQDTVVTTTGAPINTAPRTLTITPGYIKSDSFLTLWSTNAFEVFQTQGTNPLLSFDATKSLISTRSLIVGKAVQSLQNGVLVDDRYVSNKTLLSGLHVNGFARVRNATPTGPGTTGYFRNIYIGTSASPSANTGFEGAVYIQY